MDTIRLEEFVDLPALNDWIDAEEMRAELAWLNDSSTKTGDLFVPLGLPSFTRRVEYCCGFSGAT
ncbi:hypothetical protein CCACVL1_06866 [Corchorus capsularis]|uniref:Uncharacterized protein n=1 Tax=Corchorus capsularis TaxID=210143 RepID=A0A1R3JC40_COCAP|nr:hypothetical protein CCACVL1_06866 [Corchorus capsularis]